MAALNNSSAAACRGLTYFVSSKTICTFAFRRVIACRCRRRGIALVLLRNLPAGRDLVNRLAGFLAGLHVFHEVFVELGVLGKIGDRHRRAVAGDDGFDVLQFPGGLGQRVADQDAAAAVVGVEQRDVLAREDVAGVHDAKRREHHPRVAVGVAAAEVEQIDLVGALPDRHLVLERLGRQAPAVVRREDVDRRRGRRDAGRPAHLLHVGLGVFLHDDFHRSPGTRRCRSRDRRACGC